MIAALLVLGGLLVSAGIGCLRPSWVTAFVLVVFCALWFPANNGHLEGATIYVLDAHHGLTEADLISYAGFVLAIISALRWWRRKVNPGGPDAHAGRRSAELMAHYRIPALLVIVGLVAVMGSGIAFDWVHQGS